MSLWNLYLLKTEISPVKIIGQALGFSIAVGTKKIGDDRLFSLLLSLTVKEIRDVDTGLRNQSLVNPREAPLINSFIET